MNTKHWRNLARSAAIAGLLPFTALAGIPPTSVETSPDITIGFSALTAADEDVAVDGASLINLGALPASVDVTAFHRLPNGDRLVAFDTSLVLPGGQFYQPGDVARYNGASYSLEFDGSANGLPAGARIDALSANEAGDLLVSFDITVFVDSLVFADEDIALFDGANFSMVFDGSAAGVDPSLDLDALHYEELTGTFFVSFDTTGTVSAVTFADEDLVGYDGGWSMAFNGSSQDADWAQADLDAAFAVFITDLLFIDGFE